MKPSLPMAISLAGAVATMAMPVAAQQTTAPAPAPASVTCPRSQQMGEHLQRMQAMHERMAKAATPAERARLRDQQWQLMREGMDTMRGMRGMGMGMGPGAGMHGGMGMHGSMGAGMGACAGERMAMMEMMMQTMMDRMESEPSR